MNLAEPWMEKGRLQLARSIAAALRPDQHVWVDKWAEDHRILPPDTPEPGPFRNTRTPYLVDIQRTMSPGSPFREGWWMKPHQVGGSVTGENLIGAWITAAAGSMLVVFPTLDDADQWELTRFEPMRANTKVLRQRIRGADQKGSNNTKRRKRYPGGVMRLIGANRVGAMKSATIRYVKFEEPDEYPTLPQGRVTDLVIARTANFGRKAKIYGDGTPTFEGASEIERQVKRGDQRKWYLRCPDCGHAQVLVWENLKWLDGEPDTARYCCSDCQSLNDEATWKSHNYRPRPDGMTEPEAKAQGYAYWEPTAAGEPGVASWCDFEALAAPYGWRPWPEMVGKWLGAQGDQEKLQEFWNNYRGKPYTDKVRSSVTAEALQQRAEGYDLMTCPMGGLVCVAGVDTQDNRLAVVIRAYGRGEESWGIWHSEIYGDPSAPQTWAKLRELLSAPIRHASGQLMYVDAAAIDAGGHHGEDVYAFCRDAQLRGKHWFAIRGHPSYDAPKLGRPKKVDFTWRGQAVEGGAELRFVGTQAIKNIIDGRLKLAKPGGGYFHFPLAFQADYYKQMRAERRVPKRDRRGRKWLVWENTSGERNEAGDCETYAYAAFLYAMQGRYADAVWTAREKLYGRVQQMELLDDGAPRPQAVQAPALDGEATEDGDQAASAELPPQAEIETDMPTPAAKLLPKKLARPPKPKRGFVQRWR